MSVPVNVTKSEITPSEDGQNLSFSVSGEFLPTTPAQHDLLNFLTNNPDMEKSSFHLGALENGHDGFDFQVTASKKDFEDFMEIQKLMAQAKELAGPGATEEEVQAQFKKLFSDKAASNLAKQVDEASEGEKGSEQSSSQSAQ